MKRQIFSIVLGLFVNASAKGAGPDLKTVLTQLRQSPMITLEVEKKIKSELLGSESVAPGVIYITQNKFRWDSEGKEKSRVIYDGKVIWTIQDPPKGFKVPPQITKMKIDKKSAGQIFLNSLFQDKFDTQFKVSQKNKSKNDWKYKLTPIQKNAVVSDLEITIDEKGEISEIAYSDEVENKIKVVVNKIKKAKKVDTKLFEFKPPTGAQVNEI